MGRSMGGGGGRSGGGGGHSSGGRSGGSHSMGGGSRRTSSHLMGSGHTGGRSGGGYSGSGSSGSHSFGGSHSSGFGGGPGMPPPPHRHHRYYGGGYGGGYRRGYRGGYRGGYGGGYGGGVGCLTTIFMWIIILAIISSAAGMVRSRNTYHDSYSQIERTKFSGTVNLTSNFYNDYNCLYDDEKSKVQEGLKYFYDKTGVCLFVEFYEDLANEVGSDVDGDVFVGQRYDELFNDEGHLLLIYDYKSGQLYEADGNSIAVTMDAEAIDILYDYLDAAFNEDSNNMSYIWGTAVKDAADRIMYHKQSFTEKNKTLLIVLIVCIAVLLALLIFRKWWKENAKKKAAEAEQLEKILDKPLETFGNDMSDLTKKYDDKDNDTTK